MTENKLWIIFRFLIREANANFYMGNRERESDSEGRIQIFFGMFKVMLYVSRWINLPSKQAWSVGLKFRKNNKVHPVSGRTQNIEKLLTLLNNAS